MTRVLLVIIGIIVVSGVINLQQGFSRPPQSAGLPKPSTSTALPPPVKNGLGAEPLVPPVEPVVEPVVEPAVKSLSYRTVKRRPFGGLFRNQFRCR
jgi:hypothetical protein